MFVWKILEIEFFSKSSLRLSARFKFLVWFIQLILKVARATMWLQFMTIFLTLFSIESCVGSAHRRQIQTQSFESNFDDEEISKVLEKNSWVSAIHLERVRISWTPLEHSVVFYVEAKTRGYVGIGFSLDGKMANADLVVNWVDDITGKPYLIVSTQFNIYNNYVYWTIL